ncbi:Pyrroline-5-carboxylate reductase [Frankia sp. Hr75.2]|nr:Pyrroline-5-carboxylate reductase [Frankia sp. Hr75.2]
MVGSSVVAIVGAGRLGGALMSGLLRAGRTPSEVVAAERDPGRAAEITRRYGVEVVDPAAAAAKAGVVVLATKPQDMGTVLAQLAPHVAPGTLVVSVAAGITSAFVAERLAPGTPVVRAMTNTPLLVGEAMSAVCAGPGAGDEHVAAVEEMLRPVGRVVRVTETQLDAVTALSGSGPAYFFYLIEAMIEGGVLLGLPRALAAELVVQTAAGSARMLRDPGAGDPGDSDGAGGAAGEHPSLLREAVTSPGGTTVAALRQLDRGGVRAAVLDAVEAAWARSRELGAS